MNDLINRQDAIYALTEANLKSHMDSVEGGQENRSAIRIIMELPSAERKGTWIYHTEPLAFRPYGHYTCNLCNEISWDKSNFCPNCGAKMDLKEVEDEQIH